MFWHQLEWWEFPRGVFTEFRTIKDEAEKLESKNKEETDDNDKHTSEDGNGNEKKVNLRIDAKEVSQISSKLAVKSSAEISAK